jgi:hypothetical protein
MSNGAQKFLLDANILIAAYRTYYAFDLCPGFWKSVQDGFAAGRVFSTQRIRSELRQGRDALADWIEKDLPTAFFIDDGAVQVIAEFSPIMQWVESRDFLPHAKATFATVADGWLVAAAKSGSFCVVTQEARRDDAKARVLIPNVCDQFAVSYCDTFAMLRALGCSYR